MTYTEQELRRLIIDLVHDRPQELAKAFHEAIKFQSLVVAELHKLDPVPDQLISKLMNSISVLSLVECAAEETFPGSAVRSPE